MVGLGNVRREKGETQQDINRNFWASVASSLSNVYVYQ